MTNFADEAVKFWDMMVQEETAVEWRTDDLRGRAEQEAARRYPSLRRGNVTAFNAKVDTILEFLCRDDSVRNTHIANSQWYRDKAKTCALLALVQQHKPTVANSRAVISHMTAIMDALGETP